MIHLLPADLPRPKPAAMVLALKGPVELRTAAGKARPVQVEELLYPGDRLAVPAAGAATLAFLGVGVQEWLAPGSEATVATGGCKPASAVVQRREQRPAVARTMKGVRAADGDDRKAAGANFRFGGASPPPAILPIEGSTVATDRPNFAWPRTNLAKGYRVTLASGAGRELWRAETTAPSLAYPTGKEGLTRGYVYRWEVTDLDSQPVVSGAFTVATESELKQMADLRPMAAGDDRAELLAAALTYRRLSCFTEAIAALERLVTLAPEEPAYREELAELYRQAGRAEQSKGTAQ
jgi:hypothetical protein